MIKKIKLEHISLFLLGLIVVFILTSNLITAPVNQNGYKTSMGEAGMSVVKSWINVDGWRELWHDDEYITSEEAFWNPVEPWELQQCKTKLSTQVWNSATGDGISSSSPLLFDLTVSLQGEQRKLSWEDNLYETSVGWYVQHYEQDVKYSLVLLDSEGTSFDVPEEGTGPIKNKEANHVSGGAGFIAWEGDQEFNQLKLVMTILKPDGSTNFTQSYVVDFVKTVDVVD